jgi:membrane-anchored protein YejM (alkaline phosphatase superfamily)
MLKSVDECFGRILDELDKQGVADNTIIIFLLRQRRQHAQQHLG